MSNYFTSTSVYPPGTNLDSIFEAYVSGTKAANSGYQVAGSDLSDRYVRLADGLQGPPIGFLSVGVDLANIYATSPANYTLTTADLTSSRSTSWTNTLTHEFTVTFSSATARSDYFLYSGQIRFTGSRTGGAASPQNTSWTNILSNMGIVSFSKTATTRSGTSGTGSSVGNDTLTGTFQTIFTSSGSGIYSGDLYTIEARTDSTAVIRFRITMTDANDANPSFDESVDGTITSNIGQRRHTLGAPTPSFANVTLLTAGT